MELYGIVYPFTAYAIVLEGEVTLTNESTVESLTYKQGEGRAVEKGTPVPWTVHTPRLVKHYPAVA